VFLQVRVGARVWGFTLHTSSQGLSYCFSQQQYSTPYSSNTRAMHTRTTRVTLCTAPLDHMLDFAKQAASSHPTSPLFTPCHEPRKWCQAASSRPLWLPYATMLGWNIHPMTHADTAASRRSNVYGESALSSSLATSPPARQDRIFRRGSFIHRRPHPHPHLRHRRPLPPSARPSSPASSWAFSYSSSCRSPALLAAAPES